MKITVVSPMLNEMFFVKGWYKCVSKFADEILVIDTGSTDGCYEWLVDKASSNRNLFVTRWPESFEPYMWVEWKLRNKLLEEATGDWILTLDIDELVNNSFIELLNYLSKVRWYIGRFLEYLFWNDINHIRVRSWWPPVRVGKRGGRIDLTLFPSVRGMYPSYKPRLLRRSPLVDYTKKNNHCILQYRNLGRLTYRLPWLYCDLNVPVYHYHFAFSVRKKNENRWSERGKQFKTIPFNGEHPPEINYYGN